MYWLEAGPFPIYVGVCFDESVFWKELKNNGIERGIDVKYFTRGSGCAATWTFANCYGPKKDTTAIMCFNPSDAKIYTVSQFAGMIAHECVHVKQFIAEMVKEDEGFSKEFEAYLVQRLTMDVMYNFCKYYKPKFKRYT